MATNRYSKYLTKLEFLLKVVVAFSHSFCYGNISVLLVKESDTIVLLAIRCLKRKKNITFLSMYSTSGVI